MTTTTASPAFTAEQALAIAAADARQAYRSLDRHTIEIRLTADGWSIAYFVPRGSVGGGPQYLIDADAGTILQKRYYQ
jgi:hypothetical protein